MTGKHASFAERFWAKVKKGATDECWPWTAATISTGYGAIGMGRNKDGLILAHRASYEMHFGAIADPNMYVCHRCDNPVCVNPHHLFLGTPSQNSFDCSAKGRNRQPKGVSAKSAKLSESDVRDIRARPSVSILKLAREYGVHHRSIWAVRHRKTWKHL
jgi:hypothetical protein